MECEFITGPAGTGKSTYLQSRTARERRWGVLCCTTGIAAVNLGATTINSRLRYFDTASLYRAYFTRRLYQPLEELSQFYDNLIIDEISMMERDQLEIIYDANLHIPKPMGIIVVGDFCQLPPVSGEWAFRAKHWRQFDKNTTWFRQPYRQERDHAFQAALRHARAGNGQDAVENLVHEVTWAADLEDMFDGTTVMATNAEVSAFNDNRYAQLAGPEHVFPTSRWGRQLIEWEQNIPNELKLKDKTYVMILANDPPWFTYANGDCGHVVHCGKGSTSVLLKRNGREVCVEYVTRTVEQDSRPPGCTTTADRGPNGEYFDSDTGKWVVGGIEYMPIRYGYASTVHKSQGLTFDRMQLDLRHKFLGAPNMSYVALSRTRTANGLRIVGNPGMLEDRIRVHPDVVCWV